MWLQQGTQPRALEPQTQYHLPGLLLCGIWVVPTHSQPRGMGLSAFPSAVGKGFSQASPLC